MSIYDFTVKDGNGKDVKLENYRGKVLLIVNTATGCGFTPQYDGLQDLYDKYEKEGLEILDFPLLVRLPQHRYITLKVFEIQTAFGRKPQSKLHLFIPCILGNGLYATRESIVFYLPEIPVKGSVTLVIVHVGNSLLPAVVDLDYVKS